MRLYFYCVMKKFRGKLPEVNGMDGQSVILIKCHDLVAAVSSTGKSSFADTPENQRTHENVMRDFMKKHAILPFRFNCVVGETIGRGILQKFYNSLSKNLEIIKNGQEYEIKVVRHNPRAVKKVINLLSRKNTIPDPAAEQDGPQNSKITDVQTKVLAMQVHQALASLALKSSNDLLQTKDILLDAHYLVEKKKLKQFAREVEQRERLYPNIMIIARGPLPPYHFNAIDITKENNLRIGGPWKSEN